MAWLEIQEGEFINLKNVKRIDLECCDNLTKITIEFTDPHDEFPDTEHYIIRERYKIVHRTIRRILRKADRYGGVFNLGREIERTKRFEEALKGVEEKEKKKKGDQNE